MSENNEVQETRSVDDVLHGGGGPKVFAFDEVGYRITGTLKSAEMVAVRYPKDHPQAGEHKRYSKGRLAYQIKLVLTDTDDERADDEDDGTRRAFVKEFGDNRDAFAKALDERGFQKISAAYGHKLTISRVKDGPVPFKGANAEHLFAYEFNSADVALERGKTDTHTKETREDKMPKDTRALLREHGLPEELASIVGENPTPELLQALKNNQK